MLSHAEVLKRFFNGKKGTGSSLVSKGDVLLDYGWKKLAEFVEEIPEGFHAVENPEPPFLVLYQPYPSVTSSQHFSMTASYARYFGYLYICAMNRDFDVVLTKSPQDGKKIWTPFGEGVVNGTRIEVAREAQGIPYYLEIYPLSEHLVVKSPSFTEEHGFVWDFVFSERLWKADIPSLERRYLWNYKHRSATAKIVDEIYKACEALGWEDKLEEAAYCRGHLLGNRKKLLELRNLVNALVSSDYALADYLLTQKETS